MGFLRGLWRLLMWIKDALVLILLLLFFGGLYALLSARPMASIPSGGALELALNGSIVDQPTEQPPLSMLSGSGDGPREIRLRDLIRAIRYATTDSRVKAITLDLDRFQGAGQADLQSVGAALTSFKAAGKPIYAYATAYTDDGYYLAARATEAWVNPMGGVLLTGPGGSQLYYKGLLDKLAVDVNIFRVGTYKAAVEPFTRADQSPEAKLAAQALVDSLWASWRGDVTKSRPRANIAGWTSALGEQLHATNGNIPRAAQAAGLIDQIGSKAEFGRRVAKLVGPDSDRKPGGYRKIEMASYVRAAQSAMPGSGDAVGILYVSGEIVDGTAGPGVAAGDSIAARLEKALARNDIKALVVRVNSPGGSVMASERIRAAVAEAKAKRLPVVVSMGNVAASGGYWVSSAADAIYAQPSTITGSIGVFAIVPSFQNTLAKAGLSADGVKSTPLSGEPDVLRGLSPEVASLLQLSVEDIYRRFTGIVARSRHLTPARVDEIGQGRVWAGETARRIGLVDQFGGLDAAIADAAHRARLDPAKVRQIDVEVQPFLPFQLLRDFGAGGQEAVADPWAGVAAAGRAQLLAAIADAHAILGGPVMQARCLECGSAQALPLPADSHSLMRQLLKLVIE